MFTLLLQKNVVYTPAHFGQWLPVEKAVFDLLSKDEPKELLQRVLLTAGVSIVSVPSHVTDAITSHAATPVKTITPSRTRSTLKKDPKCYKKLVRREKLLLLQFCLEDCKFEKLCDLKLLPLSDGTFTTFSDRGKKIYICSPDHPQELFPGLEHRFIDHTVDGDVIEKLKDAADQGKETFLDKSRAYLTGHLFILYINIYSSKCVPFIGRIAESRAERPYNEKAYQNCNKYD